MQEPGFGGGLVFAPGTAFAHQLRQILDSEGFKQRGVQLVVFVLIGCTRGVLLPKWDACQRSRADATRACSAAIELGATASCLIEPRVALSRSSFSARHNTVSAARCCITSARMTFDCASRDSVTGSRAYARASSGDPTRSDTPRCCTDSR